MTGWLRTVVVAVITVAALSCGGSPSGPAPVPGGGGVTIPDPTNLPPVIKSITASAQRTEIDTDVTLTAVVEDAETAVSQLKLEWTAEAGTIAGEGLSVTWRAPKDRPTPKDYTIKLTVTETYGTAGAGGVRPQHVVSADSPSVRVHDSPTELGDLSVGFLTDFANSSVSPATCVRNFSDSCIGKSDEFNDISENRSHLTILGSSLTLRSVRVASNNVRANMTVACSFTSRVNKCDAGAVDCHVGDVGTVTGDCTLTGVYEQQRWWLCESHFAARSGAAAFLRLFQR